VFDQFSLMKGAPMIASVAQTITTAVGAASSNAATALKPTIFYIVSASTACWIAQGSAPTAVAGVGSSMFVPANIPIQIDGDGGAVLAVIQAAAGGFISVTPGQAE
jgi:uncharacterized RmlC-like cupin family protein